MGTNFYFLGSGEHIGKRYRAGGGRCGFLWAQEPRAVVAQLTQQTRSVAAVVDEYGREYTRMQFWFDMIPTS